MLYSYRFYAYKLPVNYADGIHFLYMTAKDEYWRLSNKTIDQPDSIIGYTISQAFLSPNVSMRWAIQTLLTLELKFILPERP